GITAPRPARRPARGLDGRPGRRSSAAEQLFRKQQVLGSNPSVGSSLSRTTLGPPDAHRTTIVRTALTPSPESFWSRMTARTRNVPLVLPTHVERHADELERVA